MEHFCKERKDYSLKCFFFGERKSKTRARQNQMKKRNGVEATQKKCCRGANFELSVKSRQRRTEFIFKLFIE
jgi:hypothetical protein